MWPFGYTFSRFALFALLTRNPTSKWKHLPRTHDGDWKTYYTAKKTALPLRRASRAHQDDVAHSPPRHLAHPSAPARCRWWRQRGFFLCPSKKGQLRFLERVMELMGMLRGRKLECKAFFPFFSSRKVQDIRRTSPCQLLPSARCTNFTLSKPTMFNVLFRRIGQRAVPISPYLSNFPQLSASVQPLGVSREQQVCEFLFAPR